MHERAVSGLLERAQVGPGVFLLPFVVELEASRAQRGLLEGVKVARGCLAAAVALHGLADHRSALDVHVAHRLNATAERVQLLDAPAARHTVLVRARPRTKPATQANSQKISQISMKK
jgi:hypothetical protein